MLQQRTPDSSSGPNWSSRVEAVYHRQARELWALFYAHCCDADRAHDALQEAFLRLQQQNGTPIRDERAWLLRVGRNWLRDLARRQKVAARPSDRLDGLPDAAGDPSTAAAGEEIQGFVRAALDQLKTDDRTVLVLRYALGWTSQRIAETLESSAPAVDMRLSRARKRLAELLEHSGVRHDFE